MIFEQIIFPSVPKTIVSTTDEFEFWIVGFGDCKQLMVKCPTCYHTYSLQNVSDEFMVKKNLREYQLYYYDTVIRNCPRKLEHVIL